MATVRFGLGVFHLEGPRFSLFAILVSCKQEGLAGVVLAQELTCLKFSRQLSSVRSAWRPPPMLVCVVSSRLLSAVPARCCRLRAPFAEAGSEGRFFSRSSLGNWLLGVRVMLCEAAALKPNRFYFKKKKCLALKIGPGTRCACLRPRKRFRLVPAFSQSFHVSQTSVCHPV